MAPPLQHADLGAAASPPLSRAEFQQIRHLAYRHFGLDIKEDKQSLIIARLGKALRSQGFGSFEQYCRHVSQDPTGQALAELADALTTNFTSFLREKPHFDFLCAQVAPRLEAGKEVDIWSAASSTGEEPYSILFTLLETLGPAVQVRVLATDISTRALAAAREAVYDAERVEALPPGWPRRYFLKGNGHWQGWYRVKPEFRALVECRRFNLMSEIPPSARFPVIFCRNVMIYFDKPRQCDVVRRLATALAGGGYLFIGHSESLAGIDHGLQYVQPAVYRAPEKGFAWLKWGSR